VNIVTRARMAVAAAWQAMRQKQTTLSPVDNRGWHTVFESFAGAWQSHVTVSLDNVLKHPIVYACVTLIASDLGKLSLQLKQFNNGIWEETVSPAFSPVLRKPNPYQTRQQFVETWMLSKLIHGNAYILKERDLRGVVVALYVLDPNRVTPLVAPDGSVYYQLQDDDLSRVPTGLPAVPAAEFIHDRMECLFHPLVGISPIYACGLVATQGLNITNSSAQFFGNRSQPGGVLTAPNDIPEDLAARMKAHWEANYTGTNAGRIAVLGSGLTYMPMTVNAADSQLVEQLKGGDELICSAFHVPAYMVGVGSPPPYNQTGALNQHYYDKCLHKLLDAIENCLDDGLGLTQTGRAMRVEFDLRDLLRMDRAAMTDALEKEVRAGITSPDEARAELGRKPVTGGDTPYLQQQNYSLAALAKRDASDDPFASKTPAPAPAAPMAEPDDSASKAVESIERIATTAMTIKAPADLSEIKALIDGLSDKQAKALDELSTRVNGLSEKDDGPEVYAALLERMTARFEAEHVA
jgi:HK97 family phage portal protein